MGRKRVARGELILEIVDQEVAEIIEEHCRSNRLKPEKTGVKSKNKSSGKIRDADYIFYQKATMTNCPYVECPRGWGNNAFICSCGERYLGCDTYKKAFADGKIDPDMKDRMNGLCYVRLAFISPASERTN